MPRRVRTGFFLSVYVIVPFVVFELSAQTQRDPTYTVLLDDSLEKHFNECCYPKACGRRAKDERLVSDQQQGFSSLTSLLSFFARCQGLTAIASVLKDWFCFSWLMNCSSRQLAALTKTDECCSCTAGLSASREHFLGLSIKPGKH